MQKMDLKVGDVVQIDPAADTKFPGCFMMVTEPKAWGAQGFVQVPAGGAAYFRPTWEQMEYIGPACWVPIQQEDSSGAI